MPDLRDLPRETAYLNLTTSLCSFRQAGHSNVRLSWSGAAGSIRESDIGEPHRAARRTYINDSLFVPKRRLVVGRSIPRSS
jgi:hypothetical protein